MFKRLFVLVLFLVPVLSRADLILAPGATVASGYRTKEANASGEKLLKMGSSFGLEVNSEIILIKIFTLNIGGLYFSGPGKSQYNFKSTTASDLDTSSIVIAGIIGPRLRLINFSRFKMFIGGGYLFGSQNLTYGEKDFKAKTGNTTNFEANDSASFRGSYLEGGMEYVMTNVSALRLSGRQLNYKTNKLRTLGGEKLTVAQFQVIVQYLHYFNWDLFWK